MEGDYSEKYVDYINLSRLSWKRPEGPKRVWRVVDGRKKMPSGEVPRFIIQEVPESMEEELVDFMTKYFTAEETITVSQKLLSDPIAMKEIRTLWKETLRQGVSLVAIRENFESDKKSEIVGVNVLFVCTNEDEDKLTSAIEVRTRKMKTVMGTQFRLAAEVDMAKMYGVDRYLGAFGLSVNPSYRGQGVADALLQARTDIGQAYQIPATETIFTGTASQIVAARNGFEVLVERKYTEILDDEGNVAFPGVEPKFMKVMGKKLLKVNVRV
ncbi:uncharacterized protein [Neodiprion pinetum]|uniref:uncharacterized protein isoform X1 n=2 Tax=Neodiprion pinetum TaxID=441929 RepID=UPI001EDDD738|nr:uncharacterized protein LOC124216504 isoform X1 [Neodiprion pinetum]